MQFFFQFFKALWTGIWFQIIRLSLKLHILCHTDLILTIRMVRFHVLYKSETQVFEMHTCFDANNEMLILPCTMHLEVANCVLARVPPNDAKQPSYGPVRLQLFIRMGDWHSYVMAWTFATLVVLNFWEFSGCWITGLESQWFPSGVTVVAL